MKTLFIFLFVANVAFTLISLAVLPERVAIHFGASGVADGWAPKSVHALLMTGIHVLLFLSFFLPARLMFLFPPKWINLPHKEYWLGPAQRPRALAKIRHFMWQFGAVLFLFLMIVSVLTLRANLAATVQLDMPVFLAALVGFLAYTAGWTVAFVRAFRVPAGAAAANRLAPGPGTDPE